MARVVIIGGHGKVALKLARLLAVRGDDVTSIIRSESQKGDVAAVGAQPVVADVEALDTDAISALVTGNDVIVWAAGAGGGDAQRTYAVDRDAAIRSIDAAVAAGVRRFIMVSYFGARADHGVAPDNSFFAYAESKAAADAHLTSTGLEWTVLGPGRLTDDEGSGRIVVGEAGTGAVSRDNVALVAAAVIADPRTARRVIEFNDGPTPVGEAL